MSASPAADDVAIRTLIARVAQLADDGDLDDYVACFTEDARWDMPPTPRVGRADIRAGGEARRAAGQTGPGSDTRHIISTVAVTLDGDRATATSYWQFFTNTREAPTLSLLGRYDDDFECRDGCWRLARRRVTVG